MGASRRRAETVAIAVGLPAALLFAVVVTSSSADTHGRAALALCVAVPASLAGVASIRRRWGIGLAATARNLTLGLVLTLALLGAELLGLFLVRVNYCGRASAPHALVVALDVVAALAYVGVSYVGLRTARRAFTVWPLAAVAPFLALLPLSVFTGGGCD
jgi:hypothetical protein